jgi:hypothetical protein
MSCKIYSGSSPIQPAAWPEVEAQTVTRTTSYQAAGYTPPPSAEI